MRTARPEEGMGVLQPVLDAEVARGNAASVDVERRLVRGDPPQAQLSRPLDRAVVEAQFDLGPLVAWWPRDPGRWDLVDTVSGAEVRSGEPSPLSWWRRRRSSSDELRPRQRLGWLGDDPRIAPTEHGAPATTARQARVHVGGPAVEAFLRIDQVLAAIDDGEGPLPDWFTAQLAPERDADAWRAWFRARDRLDQEQRKLAGWSTRWTEANWRRAISPSERTWRWVDAEVAHEHALDVTVDVLDGAPTASLTWLLHTAGAVRCGPVGIDA